jgi:hypothetical protein
LFRINVFLPRIYSARDPSDLNDLLGLKEISFLEAGLLEPEVIQRAREITARYLRQAG